MRTDFVAIQTKNPQSGTITTDEILAYKDQLEFVNLRSNLTNTEWYIELVFSGKVYRLYLNATGSYATRVEATAARDAWLDTF